MLNFYLLAFSNFFFFLGNSFFHLFPIYMDHLGATSTYIGIIMGMTGGISVFLTWTFRNKIDFMNKRRFILLAGLFSVLVYLAYFICADLYSIPVIRFFQGFVYSVGFTFGAAFVVELIPAHKRTGLIGLFGISGAITNALGPLIAEKLIAAFSFPAVFLAAMATSFFWILCVFLVKHRQEIPSVQKKEQSAHISEYKKIIPITLLFGAVFSTLFSFISHYAKELKLDTVTYFYMGYTAVLIIVRIFFNEKLNVWRKEKVIFFSFLSGIAAIFSAFILDYVHISILLALTGMLHGISHGFLYPAFNVIFVEVTPHRSGKATLVFILCFNLGGMLSSFFYGFIADIIGYSWMYLFATVLTSILFVFFYDKNEIQRIGRVHLAKKSENRIKVQEL